MALRTSVSTIYRKIAMNSDAIFNSSSLNISDVLSMSIFFRAVNIEVLKKDFKLNIGSTYCA